MTPIKLIAFSFPPRARRRLPGFAFVFPCVITCVLATSAAPAAEFPATLDWSGRSSLTLPVSGVVDQVFAQAGQRVGKGEVLASLDATLFKTGVAEQRADMDRLTEEQADAKRDLDRVQELYARTVASTTELDAAKLRFARVSSGLAAVQARVERARRQLAESELRAPFDAVILQRHAEPGLVIASQCQPTVMFTVARADELIARARLTPAQAVGLQPGGEAEVMLEGLSLNSKVRALTVDAEHRYSLEVAIPRTAKLMPGQPASIRVP
jgi:RND family efflux transporter MFP subunit